MTGAGIASDPGIIQYVYVPYTRVTLPRHRHQLRTASNLYAADSPQFTVVYLGPPVNKGWVLSYCYIHSRVATHTLVPKKGWPFRRRGRSVSHAYLHKPCAGPSCMHAK